jgi:hypothetical protein
MPNYYRPPINPGYDTIGAAIAAGLGDARASLRAGRQEEKEDQRYLAQQKRQERLDREAEAERQRRTLLENAELGVVDAGQAYDPIQSALVPERRPSERAQDWLGRAADAPSPEPKLRDGVIQTGGMFIDPRAGLGYRRQAIARDDDRMERDRLVQEGARRLQALNPAMSSGEAIARAMGLSTAQPVTEEQALAQARREMELRDEFERRAEARKFAHDRAIAGMRMGGSAGGRATVRDTLQGMALTQAYDVVNLSGREQAAGRTMAAGFDPLAYVRGRLRQQARAAGLNVTEGQIQEEAVRALFMVQDQKRQHTYAPRDPYAQDEWEMLLGGDPVATAMVPGTQPGQHVTVTRTRTPTPPAPAPRAPASPPRGSQGGSTGSERVVGSGIITEARDALRSGAGEREVRDALSGRGYTPQQVDDVVGRAKKAIRDRI